MVYAKRCQQKCRSPENTEVSRIHSLLIYKCVCVCDCACVFATYSCIKIAIKLRYLEFSYDVVNVVDVVVVVDVFVDVVFLYERLVCVQENFTVTIKHLLYTKTQKLYSKINCCIIIIVACKQSKRIGACIRIHSRASKSIANVFVCVLARVNFHYIINGYFWLITCTYLGLVLST